MAGYTIPTGPKDTDSEALRQAWAQQTGADYDTLFGGGTTQTTTGGNTGGNNTNIPADFGWGGNLPGTNVPSLGGNTTPTQTTPTSTQPTIPSQQNTSGYSVQDYINYYGGDWTKADKSYDDWVAWMQSGGGNTTTPGGTVTGGQPAGQQPSTTAGTSVQDYIDYYISRGVSQPPISYDAWVQMITSGSNTGGTQQPTGEQPTQDGQQTTTTGNDPGYDALLAAWAAQTGADYATLYYAKYGVYPSGSGTPGSGSGTSGTGGIGGSMVHELPPIAYDRTQMIRDMYDAQIAAERAALQEQGEQALSDAQANRDKIADTYNRQKNAASVDWERQRRNFLEGAMTSGLNTGAGSQAELSMMGMYQRSQNNLQGQQAAAEAEADRNIADIKRSTQAAINEAVMKNDYQKAAALLDEYKDAYNREMDRAEALASFGDFSGYANIYGEAAARQMASNWAMQNPEVALAMGLITQQQYAQLTLYSKYPALALTGGTGYSGGGGVDYSGGGSGGGSGGVSLADLAREAREAGASESEILAALESIYADYNYGPG